MTGLRPEMFALRKTAPGPGFAPSERTPTPQPGSRDVIIAVTRAGICGTDRHIYDWDSWSASRVPLGVTIGHEFVGRVAAVGEAVSRVRVGQRVSGEGHIGCGSCQPCRTGNAHICETVDIIGIDRDGCFADYLVLPEANVWPVHEAIPDDVAAILDPLGNAMHTVMRAGVSGRSVLVTGAGVIGLMAITIARAAGAGMIIATDVDARRLILAKEMGADRVFAGDDPDWPAEARRLTGHGGPEVLLEMSGNARAIQDGFAALRNGGTAALLGLSSQPVPLNLPRDIIFKGVTVHGINGRRIFETWYQVESFLIAGRLRLDPIITHRMPIREYERAFALLGAGEATKVVLVVEGEAA